MATSECDEGKLKVDRGIVNQSKRFVLQGGSKRVILRSTVAGACRLKVVGSLCAPFPPLPLCDLRTSGWLNDGLSSLKFFSAGDALESEVLRCCALGKEV